MGDFNVDLFLDKKYKEHLEYCNFKQIVSCATTDKDTLLDHIYIKEIPHFKCFFVLLISVIMMLLV